MSAGKHASFSSRAAFILAAAGSAIGLANIWKFPYIVGKYGGGAFLLLYLIFLALVGMPVFLSEIAIGRRTQKNPAEAFYSLTHRSAWHYIGFGTILTGFLVSSFYSVVSGWVFGYLVSCLSGRLYFTDLQQSAQLCQEFVSSPTWTVSYHLLFMLSISAILYSGVRKGLEKANNIFMPLFFILLFSLVFYSIQTAGGLSTIFNELFTFRWQELTPTAILVALGHSFFTLSVGQGTMVTYGSYFQGKTKLLSSALVIVLADTLVSVLSAVMIFSIVFGAGLQMDFGPKLIFETLPVIFSKLVYGEIVAILFFLFILLAAMTSQLSALEPMINYLVQSKGLRRHSAVCIVCGISALLGIPSALSTNMLQNWTLNGHTFFDGMNFLTTAILIPIGGFAAVFLAGWIADLTAVLYPILNENGEKPVSYWRQYLLLTVRWTAPILICVVFCYAIGWI